jgi:hypothetical protein
MAGMASNRAVRTHGSFLGRRHLGTSIGGWEAKHVHELEPSFAAVFINARACGSILALVFDQVVGSLLVFPDIIAEQSHELVIYVAEKHFATAPLGHPEPIEGRFHVHACGP